jgi:hypothetical protein
MSTNNRQNVSIAQLLEWATTNSNKSTSLTPIGIPDESEILRKKDGEIVTNDSSLSAIGLSEFESITMTPSGLLSVLAWMSDETYQYMSARSRSAYLRDMATRLQQQTEALAGGPLARRRRKLHDGIGSLANTNSLKPADHIDIFSGLITMLDIQAIIIRLDTPEESEDTATGDALDDDSDSEKDHGKSVYFSSNPDNWSKDKKTYIVDYYGRWIASPRIPSAIMSVVYWLEDLEIHSWKVHWFINATLTKEAIIEKLSHMHSWQPEHSRLLKATLAERLAKFTVMDMIEQIAKTD